MGELIGMLGGISGVLSLIYQLVATMPADQRKRFNDLIRRDLRVIRFRDDGVLSLLRKMGDGIAIQEAEWDALADFNDHEWAVDRSIGRIARLSEHEGLTLTLEHSRLLDRVLSMKTGLRRALQRELNYLPRVNPAVQRQQAQEFVTHIEAFNLEVEKLESALSG